MQDERWDYSKLLDMAELDKDAYGDAVAVIDAAVRYLNAQARRIAELEAENTALREAAVAAKAHCDELYDAWMRGALSEHDGKGGTRSNRNADVLRQLRAALTGESTPGA